MVTFVLNTDGDTSTSTISTPNKNPVLLRFLPDATWYFTRVGLTFSLDGELSAVQKVCGARQADTIEQSGTLGRQSLERLPCLASLICGKGSRFQCERDEATREHRPGAQ